MEVQLSNFNLATEKPILGPLAIKPTDAEKFVKRLSIIKSAADFYLLVYTVLFIILYM